VPDELLLDELLLDEELSDLLVDELSDLLSLLSVLPPPDAGALELEEPLRLSVR
jgi:superfamily II RNA helicase